MQHDLAVVDSASRIETLRNEADELKAENERHKETIRQLAASMAGMVMDRESERAHARDHIEMLERELNRYQTLYHNSQAYQYNQALNAQSQQAQALAAQQWNLGNQQSNQGLGGQQWAQAQAGPIHGETAYRECTCIPGRSSLFRRIVGG